MRAHQYLNVPLTLPGELAPLHQLATNLRWAWHPPTRALFRTADPQLWTTTGHNPHRLLTALPTTRVAQLRADPNFLARMDALHADLTAYMQQPTSTSAPTVGYFSPEFAVTPSLPLYSGGLGVLAGDHLKTASDLGIPLIGVGLMYRLGYLTQVLADNGWQHEHHPPLHPQDVGLTLLADTDIHLTLPDHGQLFARIWVAQLGRVPLLLLDTHDDRNSPADRTLTDRLYQADTLTRLRQELLLGIGGVRALRAYCALTHTPDPTVYHSNEGHAGFLGLERIRELTAAGLDFATSLTAVRAATVFTTHTPVPAGIDRFPRDLVGAHLAAALPDVPLDACLDLGADPTTALFNMAHMGLRLAQHCNGVSKPHGALARSMFAPLWPGLAHEQIPISHITNGVHRATWAPHAPDATLDDNALRAARRHLRTRLIQHARRHLRTAPPPTGPATETAWVDDCLDPDILTIGFARRVATYKRLTLMLTDPDRLRRLLLHPDHPIQLVVAGKAHPADDDGKKLIQQLIAFSSDPALRRRLVFLPDYDMSLGARMVAGCDVWLNTPLRPQEACGTSGMKAALNGGLNLSIGDGWWEECYDPAYGWAIDSAPGPAGTVGRDAAEAAALYDLLETKVIPLFYHDHRQWLRMVRAVLTDLRPTLLADRMVNDYVRSLYTPAAHAARTLTQDDHRLARHLAAWTDRVRQAWPKVHINTLDAHLGPTSADGNHLLTLRAEVVLGPLSPDDVKVQAFCGPLDADHLLSPTTAPMLPTGPDPHYQATLTLPHAGTFGYTARIVPHHPQLGPIPLGLVCEADPAPGQ